MSGAGVENRSPSRHHSRQTEAALQHLDARLGKVSRSRSVDEVAEDRFSHRPRMTDERHRLFGRLVGNPFTDPRRTRPHRTSVGSGPLLSLVAQQPEVSPHQSLLPHQPQNTSQIDNPKSEI